MQFGWAYCLWMRHLRLIREFNLSRSPHGPSGLPLLPPAKLQAPLREMFGMLLSSVYTFRHINPVVAIKIRFSYLCTLVDVGPAPPN